MSSHHVTHHVKFVVWACERQQEMRRQSVKECEDKGEKVLIVCATGKYLTSMTIGCWRKTHQQWAMSSIFEEMRRFEGVGSAQLPLEQFVEMY